MTMFVLIPGACADPRVYGLTIEALEQIGHGGLAPELPLDDPQAGPSAHAEAVLGALDRSGDLVVVAQSLGAFAGSIVAAPSGATQLVLLAPMIPAPGETAGDWWANTGHAEAIAELTERIGPMRSWGPEALAEVFLHDVDPAVARDNERYAGAPGPCMFTEPWPLEAWPEVPTRVLAPTEDRLFPVAFQRRVTRERLNREVDTIAGGHLPMLSRPRELAERLVELAADR